MKDKIIEILIAFLDQIREYELEAGHSIAQDERETKEFIDIFLSEDYKEDRPDCLEQLLSEPKASGISAEELFKQTYGKLADQASTSYNGNDMVKFANHFASTGREKEADFRKVKASDRLPEDKKEYFVIDKDGDMFTDVWSGVSWHHEHPPLVEIEYWLEEINKLPNPPKDK